MSILLSEIEQQIASLKALQQKVMAYEQSIRTQELQGKIEHIAEFGHYLNEKRKALNLDLYTLELQTDVSISTLKRLFQDPSQIRFATVLLVAETLGVSLCMK